MNYHLIYPEIFLCGVALFVLVLDLFLAREQKKILGWLCVAELILTLFVIGISYGTNSAGGALSFYNTFSTDMFSAFFKYAVTLGTILVILSSMDFLNTHKSHHGEFYCLVLLSTAAIFFLASAQDLILLYLALEFLSICSYVLAAFVRTDAKSSEAGLKYFLLGAVTSAVMLYGISFVYGLTGSTQLSAIAEVIRARGIAEDSILFFSSMLVLVGFGFKSALVPFHMWCPDTYEGAPTAVTAYLACVAKLGGLVGIFRIFWVAFQPLQQDWSFMLGVISAFSMTIGNLIAIQQTNIKRLLAYSSISHAGFILMGFASATAQNVGLQSTLVYITAYMFMNMGAFIAVMIVSSLMRSEEIEDYAGLSQRAPGLALCLAVFMLSLLGLPPLSGFIAKFYVFAAAVSGDMLWLAVVAMLNSVISAYYYLGVVRVMYLVPAKDPAPLHAKESGLNIALFLAMTATLLILPAAQFLSRATKLFSEMFHM